MGQRGKISLIVAGGEIGMTYSERQKGHIPALSAEEMVSWLPSELSEKIEVVDWSHQASSHYTVRMTTDLIEILNKRVVEGTKGIVVTCGMDSLEEMAYLTNLIWAYPQPIIFTGATHPSDTLGSDAQVNLYQAVLAASSESCWGLGVLICLQDQLFAASEASETANYRRNAFNAPDRGPVGEMVDDVVYIRRIPKRSKVLEGQFSPARNIELIWSTLGGGERMINALSEAPEGDLDGVVIAAFGNGNVFPSWIPYIKTLLKNDIPVLLISRCGSGHISKRYAFEGSACKLLEMGVLDGANLHPLQARLRLSVGIGAGLKGEDLQKYILG